MHVRDRSELTLVSRADRRLFARACDGSGCSPWRAARQRPSSA